jgi:hypothetical protein
VSNFMPLLDLEQSTGHRVRRVDLQTGVTSTIAGSTIGLDGPGDEDTDEGKVIVK